MTDMELADWLHRWRECLRCEAPCQAYPCICSQRTDAIIAALRRGPERPPSGEMVMVRAFADRIEALAFKMEAPNAYTPQFVQIAQEMRTEAYRQLSAAEASKEAK